MLFKRAAIRQIYEKQRFLDDRVSMLWVKITGAQALSSSLGGNWEGVEESVVLPDAKKRTANCLESTDAMTSLFQNSLDPCNRTK